MTLYRRTSKGRVAMTPQEEIDFELARAPSPPSTSPRDYKLNRQQFAWLLTESGLDDVLNAARANAKGRNRSEAAALEFALEGFSFDFDKTLAMIAQFSQDLPQGTTVNETNLSPLWLSAAAKV